MKFLLRVPRPAFCSLKNPQLSAILNPSSANYMEHLYGQWLAGNGSELSPSLQAFFTGIKEGVPDEQLWQDPASSQARSSGQSAPNLLKAKLLIEAYRSYGHNYAALDPLGLDPTVKQHGRPVEKPDLSPEFFGLNAADLEQEYSTALISPGFNKGKLPLRDIIGLIKKVYCENVGFQFMHITDKTERDFVADKIELLDHWYPSHQFNMETLHAVSKDHAFATFLEEKFNSSKRFGIEGCESVICGLQKLVTTAVEHGVKHVTVGMAHRGRLSTIYNIFNKPAHQIFEEFMEKKQLNTEDDETGDVKYHLGYHTIEEVKGKKISLELVPNPSHLQAVDPLVYGISRALQDEYEGPTEERKRQAIPVVIHGDAAIAGQGIVYESIQLHDLYHYAVGGVIHIVVNNQVGFTTAALQSRSTVHCTEIAKVVNAPVIHVNGDRPDLVSKCIEFAVEYRQLFQKDVFIDVIGFRKFGHNEQDQPAFTQPMMYHKIQGKDSVWKVMTDKLIREKVVTQAEVASILAGYKDQLRKAYEAVVKNAEWPRREEAPQFGMALAKESPRWGSLTQTGVARGDLRALLKRVTDIPASFNVHPTIKKILGERMSACEKDEPMDWATMECLAFASLAEEGYGVRLSGQDVERGTFSHRHAVLNDQKEDKPKYMGLGQISSKITITNSLLSEFGVMGFEYGYSVTNPNCLTLWEGQFGDFANTAQVMIDNFIASGESKWNQQTGLVLLLPHGMDGQGPEHSSCRLERFLQLSNDDPEDFQDSTPEDRLKKANLHVVYCSKSGNYFHALRRQLRKAYRKPLIVLNSKRLLRFKKAGSLLKEVDEGTEFRPLIDSETAAPQKVSRVIFCSGQFYYDLQGYLEESPSHDEKTALVRVEQFSPFPYAEAEAVLQKYSKATEIVWSQEEHQNQGGYLYCRQRIEWLMKKAGLKGTCGYLGRPPSSASACGSLKRHKEEEAAIKTLLLK